MSAQTPLQLILTGANGTLGIPLVRSLLQQDMQIFTTDAFLGNGVDARIQTVENPKTENDQRDDDNDG